MVQNLFGQMDQKHNFSFRSCIQDKNSDPSSLSLKKTDPASRVPESKIWSRSKIPTQHTGSNHRRQSGQICEKRQELETGEKRHRALDLFCASLLLVRSNKGLPVKGTTWHCHAYLFSTLSRQGHIRLGHSLLRL